MSRLKWASAVLLVPLLIAAAEKPWKIVSVHGPIFMIYVEPSQAKNKELYASIVQEIFSKVGETRPFQLDFFDDLEMTPTSRRYSAQNRAHQRARFNYNPANGMKRFAWVVPVDPEDPGGKRKLIVEELPLPTGGEEPDE